MIIQTNAGSQLVKFQELELGEVFKTCEGFFEKTTEINGYNSVNMDTGKHDAFCDTTVVVRVKGKFVEE